MSIDAKVSYVKIEENGGGNLQLEDRPASPGSTRGIAGQKALHFDSAPEEVTALNGCEVWGSSNCLMLGDVRIAERIGYASIKFVARDVFNDAVTKYWKR